MHLCNMGECDTMDFKDYQELGEMMKENQKEFDSQFGKKEEKETNIHGDCQYVWAPDKGIATVIYILVMIFGSIFNARLLIWAVATLVYFNYID